MESRRLFDRTALRRRYAVTSVVALGCVAVAVTLVSLLAARSIASVAVEASRVGDVTLAEAALRFRRLVFLVTGGIFALLAAIGVVAFVPLFKQILDQQERLFDLARTDPLTGSYNRRSFEEVLTREMMRFKRSGRAPALLMLDIDHFKAINDNFGHQAGDAAIIHFVSTTLSTVRTSDTFGRLGGEEFAVLLPETDREGALSVAEKVRTAVESTPLVRNGTEVSMTVSIGGTVATREMTVSDLVARADQALYAAKTAGRNRSHFYEER